jgi:hypothetical protein
VIFSVKVVPGVIVAPAPVVAVWNSPRLEKVKGFAFTELLTPVNVRVSVLPGAPNEMLLPPPLNEPAVEKVTMSARAAPWLRAKIAIKAILKARDLMVVKASVFITSSVDVTGTASRKTGNRAGRGKCRLVPVSRFQGLVRRKIHPNN